MKIYIPLLLLVVGSFMTAQAQEGLQVSGTVSDQTNKGLVGVSVSIKDKVTGGTMTNDNGRYTIKTDPFTTLIFSHVGYITQEIKLKDKAVLNVQMKQADSSAMTQ